MAPGGGGRLGRCSGSLARDMRSWSGGDDDDDGDDGDGGDDDDDDDFNEPN